MRKRRVLLAAALSVVLLCNTAALAAEPGSEVQAAAAYLRERGVMVGNESGDMMLESGLTRAQLVVLLTRLHSGGEVEADMYGWACCFMDVPAWAKPYVGYCTAMRMMNGYSGAAFGPDDPVSPAMACTVVLRACGYADGEGSAWSYDTACSYAVSKGFLSESTAREAAITRGDMAVLICRALGDPAGGSEGEADVTRYIPQVGDVIRCDDGSEYTITDVSRYDANTFADGPLGPLPEPACDWSQFDQPEFPAAEARRFQTENGDYLFLRDLYETQRMLYTLYNAMGEDDATWSNGGAVIREDGTPWVHIELTMSDELTAYSFWPWREDQVTDFFHSRPGGTFYLEAWDVFVDGVFQRTEYNIRAW